MRVTIHQPEFAPWLGFFDKVSRADRLILLDDVQFRKNYFQNRNRLRTAAGSTWVTIPVEREDLATTIREVRVARQTDPRWARRIEMTLEQSYARAPHVAWVLDGWRQSVRPEAERLVDATDPLLRWMMAGFGLKLEVCLSSSMGVSTIGSQRILDLCRAAGATTYLSGVSGRDYLDVKAFEEAGIAVEFQEFHHPVYPQLHGEFLPQMSALETLCLFGPSSRELLSAQWPQRLEMVFT